MLAKIFGKHAMYGTLPLRLILGIVFIVHGYVKLFGGLEGFTGALGSMSVPAAGFFAILLAVLEFFGGILILIGLFTRYVSLLIMIEMIFALFLVHFKMGFLITGQAFGYEFVLTLILVNLSLVLFGSGPWSLEKKIFGREL